MLKLNEDQVKKLVKSADDFTSIETLKSHDLKWSWLSAKTTLDIPETEICILRCFENAKYGRWCVQIPKRRILLNIHSFEGIDNKLHNCEKVVRVRVGYKIHTQEKEKFFKWMGDNKAQLKGFGLTLAQCVKLYIALAHNQGKEVGIFKDVSFIQTGEVLNQQDLPRADDGAFADEGLQY